LSKSSLSIGHYLFFCIPAFILLHTVHILSHFIVFLHDAKQKYVFIICRYILNKNEEGKWCNTGANMILKNSIQCNNNTTLSFHLILQKRCIYNNASYVSDVRWQLDNLWAKDIRYGSTCSSFHLYQTFSLSSANKSSPRRYSSILYFSLIFIFYFRLYGYFSYPFSLPPPLIFSHPVRTILVRDLFGKDEI
jgi:hypothetical protein